MDLFRGNGEIWSSRNPRGDNAAGAFLRKFVFQPLKTAALLKKVSQTINKSCDLGVGARETLDSIHDCHRYPLFTIEGVQSICLGQNRLNLRRRIASVFPSTIPIPHNTGKRLIGGVFMKPSIRVQSGFSLVSALVAIAILGIFTLGLASNFN